MPRNIWLFQKQLVTDWAILNGYNRLVATPNLAPQPAPRPAPKPVVLPKPDPALMGWTGKGVPKPDIKKS